MKATMLGMIVLLVVFVAGNLRAEDGEIVSVPDYMQYLTDLRESLQEGKPKPMSAREWRMFDQADRSIRSILSGREKIDDLPRQQALDLHNSQETIKALLAGREDERTICKREARVGTNFRQTRCVSLATRQQEQRNAEHMMRRLPQPWRENFASP